MLLSRMTSCWMMSWRQFLVPPMRNFFRLILTEVAVDSIVAEVVADEEDEKELSLSIYCTQNKGTILVFVRMAMSGSWRHFTCEGLRTTNGAWSVPPTNEGGSCLIVFRWTIIKNGWMDEDKQIDTVSYDSAAVVVEQQPKKNGSFGKQWYWNK